MKLIVGLGNIGREYAETRHNIGFKIVDYLAKDTGVEFTKQSTIFKDMELARNPNGGFILLKPHTMMNLSGRAVEAAAYFYRIGAQDIWVIHDDFDLEFGTLRIRQGGSSGGHNGLKSIIHAMGEDFGRVRVGVGNSELKNPLPSDVFVLSKFNPSEEKQLDQIIEQTATIVENHINDGELKDTTFKLLGE